MCQQQKCRGCKKEQSLKRADYYGIFTGYWCDNCYEDPKKYHYRKDRYPTMEYDGYGERLYDY